MNSTQFDRCFPLGSHLCREPMPPLDELKRDMANLKARGFNLVKLQEHWQLDEPQEGHYDFSRYEELIEEAARLDLGVYLGLTCEQAPAWLYRKHPDCRMVGRAGHSIVYEAVSTLPADGKPGPCYDHPGAMSDQLRFIRKLVGTLGRYENLVVWNTWQEIGYWAKGITGDEVCCCPYTLKAFRAWLAQTFGDLDGLNRAWNTRFGAWEDVQPARTITRKVREAVNLTWQYFMDNVQIARVLKMRAETIKSADPLKRPVFAHKGKPLIGSGQDWAYARAQDFLGASMYPAWGSGLDWDDWKIDRSLPLPRYEALRAEMYSAALCFDYLRSCNPPGKPVWAAEFQGGPVSTGLHLGRVPSPDDIRRWMLTALGSGVTAISFWVTRAEIAAGEMNGFSLLDSVGDTNPRFEEAGRVGQALNRRPELFARPTLKRSKVAIGVSEWNYQICLACLTECWESLEPYSVRGWHWLLWEAGIPADFVEINRLDNADPLKPEVLILPFPLALSEPLADKLRRFVEQGGVLICEAAPGRITEYGFCNRGELSPVMAGLFGVRQTSFRMVREPENGRRWSPQEWTWGEYEEPAMLTGTDYLQGRRLRANVYIETFECLQSKPCLLYNGQAAGTFRRVGRGQAWLLGTYAGPNGTAYRDPETRACVLRMLECVGVKPEHDGKLVLRKRQAGNSEAWLFTNLTDQEITEEIDVTGWNKAEDLLAGRLPIESGKVRLTVKSLDVAALIVSK